ncbi:MAG: glycosyltransferase [Candidatus Omnitrophica bacterium]|nr:glycosyltransferase [Candidatus Omnitrophota bacterium]
MKKIKVAQIITRLDWGGSTDIVRYLCQNLKDNYQITLISGFTEHLTLKTKEFLKNFDGKIIFIPYLRRDINIFYDILAFIKLYRLFCKEKFDIVHTHTSKASFLVRLVAFLTSRKIVIYSTHGHIFYGYFNRFLSLLIILIEKFLTYFTTKIVVSTLCEKEDFIKYNIAKADKLVVIYPFLEFQRYKRVEQARKFFNLNEEDKIVGLIARLEPVKGVLYFLEAAKLIIKERQDVKFIIAGEGSLRKRMLKDIKNLKLENKFIFLGWQEDINKLLSCMDVLVVPSLNEAVGLVILEAHILCVPVVATKVGGIPQITKNNETAILIEPKNPVKIKGAVLKILTDNNLKDRLIKNAYLWVKEKFLPQKFIKEVDFLYEKLLQENNIFD